MQPQELRIGNRCLWDNGNGTFTPYTIENYLDLKYADNLKPIELTEEILLKCEMVSRPTQYFEGYTMLSIKISSIYLTISKKDNDDFYLLDTGYVKVKIKQLHQLQNIIFCLTGKELEYKQ